MEDLIKGELDWHNKVNENFHEVDSQMADKVNNYILNKFRLKFKQSAESLYGKLKRITIIGDSYSQGAGSLVAQENSWSGILRKFLKHEFGNLNYGFVNFKLPEAIAGLYDEDIIEITSSGSWSELSPDGTYIAGYHIESSTSGDTLNIKVKKDSNIIRLYFENNADGGIFNIAINGDIVKQVDTRMQPFFKGSLSEDINVELYPADYELTITKVDNGRTAFIGMELIDSDSYTTFENYSKSGIALVDYDMNILNTMLDSDVVFFSLGFNDKYSRNDINGFTDKITNVINTINNNGALLIIIDFLLYDNISDPFRQQLLRLHNEVPNSIYIPIADVAQITYSNGESSGMIANGHPTPLFNQMIAEFIAKILGLSISSKSVVEKIEDKTSIVGIRNLLINTQQVFVNSNNQSISLDFVGSLWNIIAGRTITISLNCILNIPSISKNADYGFKTILGFEDGKTMVLNLTRNSNIEQGYNIKQQWQNGNYAGIVSKQFKMPTTHGNLASVSAILYTANLSDGFIVGINNLMFCIGDKLVNYIPAMEDFQNRLNMMPINNYSSIPNNSIFIDAADNLPKFKDNAGTIKAINLT